MVEVKYRKYKPHGAYVSLSNDRFVLDVDDESGVIKGLYFKDDFNNANFMGNEENQRINVAWRGRYVPDMFHRAPIQGWTGDIVLRGGPLERLGGLIQYPLGFLKVAPKTVECRFSSCPLPKLLCPQISGNDA